MLKVTEDGFHKTYSFMGIRFHRRVFSKKNYNLAIRASIFANTVAKIHSRSFDEFKGCNTGKSVALIATGPSLAEYKPIPNIINVGVNKAFAYDKIILDYLFIQDYNTKDYIYKLLEDKYSGIKKFLGILPQNNLIIPESLAIKLSARRYYTDEAIKPHRFTYNISTSPLGDFNSVAFSAMQFILWTNPAKIYLVGCDCSSSYFDGSKAKQSMDYLVNNWKKLNEFAKIYYPDTEIISINPIGLKGIFKDEFH